MVRVRIMAKGIVRGNVTIRITVMVEVKVKEGII
jgi:hypothetical protein